jgi:hypothetical protein
MSDTAPRYTPAELGMHRRLFSVRAKHGAPVDDAAMWNTLRELRKAPELARFGLFLVGSRLDPGNEASDVDVILAPRPGSAFTDARIERALWHCREYGLYGANPACLIDPSFRRQGPSCRAVPLPPTAVLQTAKLFAPRVARLVSEGRIQHYRRFGRFSIEYWRQAGETDFYKKLPQQRFDGSLCAYLRPAIEVTCDLPC